MAVEEKQLYLRGESRPKLESCVYNMTKNLVILLRICVEKAKKFKKKNVIHVWCSLVIGTPIREVTLKI